MESEAKAYSIPKYYARVCEDHPKEYSDFKNFKLSWGSTNFYELIKKVGRGRYSEVYEGINSINNQRCVIKLLKPIKKKKIQKEVKILQILGGGPNIIDLYDYAKDYTVSALIFEAIDNKYYKDFYPLLTEFEVRYYIYQVLLALDYSHSHGIMHRDIKPNNIMIDNSTKKVRVIDWGLADFFHLGKKYHVSVASRFYKAPELLVGDNLYDYAIDMWSLGCTLADMMFKNIPLFKGEDNNDQLVKIVSILGSEGLMNYVKRYGIKLKSYFKGKIENHERIPWTAFISPNNLHLVSEEGLDILTKMLTYDKRDRITAKDALEHPFFHPVIKYLEDNKKQESKK